MTGFCSDGMFPHATSRSRCIQAVSSNERDTEVVSILPNTFTFKLLKMPQLAKSNFSNYRVPRFVRSASWEVRPFMLCILDNKCNQSAWQQAVLCVCSIRVYLSSSLSSLKVDHALPIVIDRRTTERASGRELQTIVAVTAGRKTFSARSATASDVQ